MDHNETNNQSVNLGKEAAGNQTVNLEKNQANGGQAGGANNAQQGATLQAAAAPAASSGGFNKTVYIVIIIVLTVLCVLLGITVHLFKNFILNRGSGGSGFGKIITESSDLSAFEDIDIDADMLTLELRTGKGYSMEFTGNEKLMPEVNVDNSTLEVKQKSVNGRGRGKIEDVKCKLVLTVPEDCELDEIDINADLGDIEIKGISAGRCSVDADVGNIEFKDVKAKSLTIDADCGNIDISNMETKGNMNVDADLGNVIINRSSFKTAVMDADMGNLELQNCIFESGEFTTDVGNIAVSGTFDEVTAECAMGAVSVNSDDLSGAVLDLKADMGAVTVNGEGKGMKYRQ